MTRIYPFSALLIFIALIPFAAYGQDWMPFNDDREYYWIQSEDTSTILESIVISETSNNIFNSELCDFWFPEEMLNYYRNYSTVMNRDKPAFFYDLDDRVLINDFSESVNNWYDLEIRYAASPGDEWTTRGYDMICDSVYTMEVFGVMDSVKSIRCTTAPLDTIQYILTKNHGFMQYSPLRNFHDTSLTAPRPYFHLAGYRTDSTQTGLVQPEFDDYFVQQPGDILLWQEIVTLNSVDTSYAVDTIRSVKEMDGLVRYETTRGVYDVNWEFRGAVDTTLIYDRAFEGILLESPISWVTDPDSLTFFYRMEPQEVYVKEDTSILTRVINTATSIEPENCMINLWFDVSAQYRYETGRGLTYRYTGGLGGFFMTELIGSVIDGKEVGMTEIPVVSSTIQPDFIEIAIYPNPASSQIFIRDVDRFEYYAIYDQLGQIVQSRRTGATPIDVANLRPGTYVLEIYDDRGKSGVARFVIVK